MKTDEEVFTEIILGDARMEMGGLFFDFPISELAEIVEPETKEKGFLTATEDMASMRIRGTLALQDLRHPVKNKAIDEVTALIMAVNLLAKRRVDLFWLIKVGSIQKAIELIKENQYP